jgi:orotate phosphoribosyltransferase
MNDASRIAEALIDIGAVGFTPQAPITFKSGMRSPIYIDNRQIPFHPQVWRMVINGFEALINELGLPADVIAGIETAGIPHGSALAYQMQRSSVFVRKQEKEHGAKKRIEGGDVSGKHVLLIEDHITTGGSSLAGVEALRTEGALVNHCLAITSYGFPEASAMFNTAGVALHVLVTLPTILEAAHHKGRFGEAELTALHDWAHDPYGWAERQGLAK